MFPESLVKDQTKCGKQATVVHQNKKMNFLFLTLENGTLILSNDGTWKWEERCDTE